MRGNRRDSSHVVDDATTSNNEQLQASAVARKVTADLRTFLKPFPLPVRRTALALRSFILDLYPESFELIYDNYNALAVGYAVTAKAGDAFCSIAIYSAHVNFGFNRGSELDDPRKLLEGSGTLYRYITVRGLGDLPAAHVKALLKKARSNALKRLGWRHQKEIGTPITKSISTRKRRPS